MSSTTCLNQDRSPSQQTLSAEDSPANHSARQGSGKERKMKGGSGRSSTGPFAQFGPDGLLLKMSQGCFQSTMDGSLQEYSKTFPKQGMMRNGALSALRRSEHHTSGKDCSSWPTPTESMQTVGDMEQARYAGNDPRRPSYAKANRTKWPTPNAGDGKRGRRDPDGRRGKLLTDCSPDGSWKGQKESTLLKDNHAPKNEKFNPSWVECLMGFPVEWTICGPRGPLSNSINGSRQELLLESKKTGAQDSNASETPSSQVSRSSSDPA